MIQQKAPPPRYSIWVVTEGGSELYDQSENVYDITRIAGALLITQPSPISIIIRDNYKQKTPAIPVAIH